ncbi:selenocysteine-specific translation elongation factor [soil metagenome]
MICTAGHVDHGKSSLVTALTGMQPDRFAEEQQRGLTIDLGFGWFDIDDDHTVAFIDLPGHERFIANMLAGAGPVEIALLVVAANEGLMPQTREHLQILDLLGVRDGVVALTKTDLVDDDLAELAELEVREELATTTLADAPVVATSAHTGAGLAELRDALRSVCDRVGAATDRARPRLWIDRAFTIRGAGTVVTGTLDGGGLTVGDGLEIAPAGTPTRARGLHSLNRAHDRADAGSRVAVNLVGVDLADVARGDALVRPDQWRPTTALDAWVRVVDGQRLRHTGAWHLHVGSAEHLARVWPLDRHELAGGTSGPVRIEVDHPVIVTAGDRFVIRDVGRGTTVAGGPVLDPDPPPRPRGITARRRRAAQLDRRRAVLGDPAALLALHVAERGAVPRDRAAAAVALARTDRPADTVPPPDGITLLGDHYADTARLRVWVDAARSALADHHAAHPLARTAPRSILDLALAAAGCPSSISDDLLAWAQAHGDLARDGAGVRLPEHRVELDDAQQQARAHLLAALDAEPFAPPGLAEAAAAAGASTALVRELEASGDLVRLAPDVALTATAVAKAVDLLRSAVAADGPVTASQARQVLATSRRFALPLLEELDRRGVTRRAGDTRTVIAPSAAG